MSGALHTDVLVAGLGPSGACAAYEAARAGWGVLAIDRKTSAGLPVQCAELVPGPIGLEIADASATQRQAISSMVTFVEDATPDTLENFPGFMIDRDAFDRHLCSMAANEGATCTFGATVNSVSSDGVVRLSSGTQVTARVIIGADGPKSVVGKAIGQVNRSIVETRQMTVALKQPYSATDIFLSADIPGGYGWLFPKDNVANIGIGVRRKDKSKLKGLLARLHQALVEQGRVGEDVNGYTGGPIPVGGMLKPNGTIRGIPVLLAGDAAGLTNPVTGAGINAAVLSGRRAGQAAAAFLSGDTAAGAEYTEELADLFKPGLNRAVKRREELLAKYNDGTPRPRDLQRGWIAYPEYWAA